MLVKDNEKLSSILPLSDLLKVAPFFHPPPLTEEVANPAMPVLLSHAASQEAANAVKPSPEGVKCLSCHELFTSYASVLTHCRKGCKATANDFRPTPAAFACELCSKTFTRKAYLEEHQARHKGNTNISSVDEPKV